LYLFFWLRKNRDWLYLYVETVEVSVKGNNQGSLKRGNNKVMGGMVLS
jgi:hypothetical protein